MPTINIDLKKKLDFASTAVPIAIGMRNWNDATFASFNPESFRDESRLWQDQPKKCR